MLKHYTPPHAQALTSRVLLESPAHVWRLLSALLPQHSRDSLALALMVPLIAFLLFWLWWLPITLRKIPLPRTGVLRTFRRLGKCMFHFLTRFFTLVLIRPARRVAQRHGWWAGLWTFCLLLSLFLTVLVNLFPLPAGVHLIFVPLLAFLITGYGLMKAFPHVFIARTLQPLAKRKRKRRHSWHKR